MRDECGEYEYSRVKSGFKEHINEVMREKSWSFDASMGCVCAESGGDVEASALSRVVVYTNMFCIEYEYYGFVWEESVFRMSELFSSFEIDDWRDCMTSEEYVALSNDIALVKELMATTPRKVWVPPPEE